MLPHLTLYSRQAPGSPVRQRAGADRTGAGCGYRAGAARPAERDADTLAVTTLASSSAPIVSSPVRPTAVDAGRCAGSGTQWLGRGSRAVLHSASLGAGNDSKMTAWVDSVRQVQGRIGPGAVSCAGGGNRCWRGCRPVGSGRWAGHRRACCCSARVTSCRSGVSRRTPQRLPACHGRCRRWNWTACWNRGCAARHGAAAGQRGTASSSALFALRRPVGFEIDRQTPFESSQVSFDVRELGAQPRASCRSN